MINLKLTMKTLARHLGWDIPSEQYNCVLEALREVRIDALLAQREVDAKIAEDQARVYHHNMEGTDGADFTRFDFGVRAAKYVAGRIRTQPVS